MSNRRRPGNTHSSGYDAGSVNCKKSVPLFEWLPCDRIRYFKAH